MSINSYVELSCCFFFCVYFFAASFNQLKIDLIPKEIDNKIRLTYKKIKHIQAQGHTVLKQASQPLNLDLLC